MGTEAKLVPPSVAGQPGSVAACDLRVRNAGGGPESLRLEIAGEDARWGEVLPATLTLGPGEEAAARVIFRLPRGPEPPAGERTFAVRVVPASGEPVVAEGTLEVGRFANVFAGLSPRVAAGKRSARYELSLENRGNAPVAVTLRAGAEGDRLAVDLDPPALTLAAGESLGAAVTARPLRARLRGKPRSIPFDVLVEPDEGRPATVQASMQQDVLLPAWVLPVAAVVLVALAAGVVRAVVAPPRARPAPGAAASSPGCPAAGHIERRGETFPFNYSFESVKRDGCTPIRFNPCEPIHYVLNPSLAPPGAEDDLHEAFRRVADATGMTFVFDGPTDEDVARREDRDILGGRRAFQPERYGIRWAPVLVSWGKIPPRGELQVAGAGRSMIQQEVIVSGFLQLNVEAIVDKESRAPVPNGFGRGITWGRVMLHELGHVVGLGHVESRAQIMYEELSLHTSPRAEYGLGDVAGLRQLGRQAGCVTPPPLPAASPG